MQATQEDERRYHLNVHLGDKRVRTKFTYTREQAEEINELVADSAKEAQVYDEIVPRKVTPTSAQ